MRTVVTTAEGQRYELSSAGDRTLRFGFRTAGDHEITIATYTDDGTLVATRAMTVTTTHAPVIPDGVPDYVPVPLFPHEGQLIDVPVADGAVEQWPDHEQVPNAQVPHIVYDRNHPRLAFIEDILAAHEHTPEQATDLAWLAARATPVADYEDASRHRVLVDQDARTVDHAGRALRVRPFQSGYFTGTRWGRETNESGTIVNGEVAAIVTQRGPGHDATTGQDFYYGWTACLGLMGVVGTRVFVVDDGTMDERRWWVPDGEDVADYRVYAANGDLIGTYASPLATGQRTKPYTQANNRVIELWDVVSPAFANVAFRPPGGTDDGTLPITLWSGLDFRGCDGGTIVHCDLQGFSGGTGGFPPEETADIARVRCTGRWYIADNLMSGRRPDGTDVEASPLSDSQCAWGYSIVARNRIVGRLASMRTSWECEGPEDEVMNETVDAPGPNSNDEDTFGDAGSLHRYIRPIVDTRTYYNGRGDSGAQMFNIIAGDSNRGTLSCFVQIIDPEIRTWGAAEYGSVYGNEWGTVWDTNRPAPAAPYMLTIGSNRPHTSRLGDGDTSTQEAYTSLPMTRLDGSLHHLGVRVIRDGEDTDWGWDWQETLDPDSEPVPGRPLTQVIMRFPATGDLVTERRTITSPADEKALIEADPPWKRERTVKPWQSPGPYEPETRTRVYG